MSSVFPHIVDRLDRKRNARNLITIRGIAATNNAVAEVLDVLASLGTVTHTEDETCAYIHMGHVTNEQIGIALGCYVVAFTLHPKDGIHLTVSGEPEVSTVTINWFSTILGKKGKNGDPKKLVADQIKRAVAYLYKESIEHLKS